MKSNVTWKYFSKKIIIFLLFQVVFGMVTMPILVLFGPFENIKRATVGSIMTTYSHQYFATTFLTQKAIDRIMSNDIMDVSVLDNEDFGILKNPTFSKVNYNDRIEIFNIDGGSFEAKLIIIHDPRRVVVGYSSQIPKSGETTSSIAKRNKSVAAINAGGFVDKGWTGTGGAPLGFVIHNGNIVHNDPEQENKKQDTIAFTDDGVMVVGRHTVSQLLKIGVKEGVSFGPPLIIDGIGMIRQGDGGWGIAPRTAIAQRKDGAVMFFVADGRRITSVGATLRDIQEIFLQNGAITAANLDGGSSTTMYFNGKVVNKPSDALGERTVPSVFMVSPQ
jgi:exopolysaccharide biosynthesis protein